MQRAVLSGSPQTLYPSEPPGFPELPGFPVLPGFPQMQKLLRQKLMTPHPAAFPQRRNRSYPAVSSRKQNPYLPDRLQNLCLRDQADRLQSPCFPALPAAAPQMQTPSFLPGLPRMQNLSFAPGFPQMQNPYCRQYSPGFLQNLYPKELLRRHRVF